MAGRVCQAAGCGAGTYAKGWCERHYRQVLRTGQVRADPGERPCAVASCGRRAVTRGWCHGHYLRWHRTGDVRAEVPLTRPERGVCTVQGCGRPHASQGLCEGHRARRAQGDLRAHLPLGTPTGAGGLSHGYVKMPVPVEERWLVNGATSALQHRWVMARMLGRPLRPDESVHHRNGDRTDNRPENLELWTRFQPAGGRVADKLAWAEEMIRRYGAGAPRDVDQEPPRPSGEVVREEPGA